MLTARVLGPVEIISDASALPLGGRLARRLAAALVLHRGSTISDDVLVEAMWGESFPANATASIHAYVSRLRSQLGRHRGSLIRADGGYRLILDRTDLDRFERLLSNASRMLPTRPAEACALSQEALTMWGGAPYSDLDLTDLASAERARLEELYESVTDTLISAHVRRGSAAEAVAEARRAIDRTPFRERRWALLVHALYRCGRQADAMHELRAVKTLLADELGIDPGPDLQDLERRVFAGDATLLVDAVVGGVAETSFPIGIPRPHSSFHGREDAVEALTRAHSTHRLVSVVGPGGVGKTRLIAEWAQQAQPGDASWYVSLADLTDEFLVPSAVAESLGVRAWGGDVIEALATALGGRRGILLMDNCEHVLASVRDLVSDLLLKSRVTVVVTSREALGVDGEAVVEVKPLDVAAPDDSDGPAMEMLLTRIRSVRGEWTPTAEEVADARRLCHALEGLPLAIELAAVRARTMSLSAIATGVRRTTTVLGEVPTGSVATHADLSDTVAWSYHLLRASDRELLVRLWPFEGGFDLELAALAAPHLSEADVLASLSSLVSKSLVAVDLSNGRTRYRLWESVRVFVREQPQQEHAAQESHFRAVSAFVRSTTRVMASSRSRHAMRSLTFEIQNIRAMLAFGSTHAPESALESFVLLEWFWFRAGLFREAISLADALLDSASAADPELRARALMSRAVLSHAAGDHPAAAKALQAARGELGRLPVESLYEGRIAYFFAASALPAGQVAEAEAAVARALAIAERFDDRLGEINARMLMGAVCMAKGEVAAGRHFLELAASIASLHGTPWTIGMASLHLARALAPDLPQSTRDVSDALRVAVRVFLDESDMNTLCQTTDVIAAFLDARRDEGRARQLRQASADARRSMGIASLIPSSDVDYAAGEDAGSRLRSLTEAWLKASAD